MADLIDRQALMDAFRKYMVEKYDRERCATEENCKICERGCLWRNVVMAAPAIDAEPVKHGRWGMDIDFVFSYELEDYICEDHYTCSLCDYDSLHNTTYCPNCGAKMDLED